MDENGQKLLAGYQEKVGELRGMNTAKSAEISVLAHRLHKQSTQNLMFALAGFIVGMVIGVGLTVLLMRQLIL